MGTTYSGFLRSWHCVQDGHLASSPYLIFFFFLVCNFLNRGSGLNNTQMRMYACDILMGHCIFLSLPEIRLKLQMKMQGSPMQDCAQSFGVCFGTCILGTVTASIFSVSRYSYSFHANVEQEDRKTRVSAKVIDLGHITQFWLIVWSWGRLNSSVTLKYLALSMWLIPLI